MERTAEQRFLVAHKFQESRIILGTTANEVHSVRVGGVELYILAAVEETLCKLLPDKKVKRSNGHLLTRCPLGGGDVHECRLVGRTCERAEERAEVIPTGRASGKQAFNGLEVVAKCLDLVGGAADGPLCVFGATDLG